jgi:hypothetical protein
LVRSYSEGFVSQSAIRIVTVYPMPGNSGGGGGGGVTAAAAAAAAITHDPPERPKAPKRYDHEKSITSRISKRYG